MTSRAELIPLTTYMDSRTARPLTASESAVIHVSESRNKSLIGKVLPVKVDGGGDHRTINMVAEGYYVEGAVFDPEVNFGKRAPWLHAAEVEGGWVWGNLTKEGDDLVIEARGGVGVDHYPRVLTGMGERYFTVKHPFPLSADGVGNLPSWHDSEFLLKKRHQAQKNLNKERHIQDTLYTEAMDRGLLENLDDSELDVFRPMPAFWVSAEVDLFSVGSRAHGSQRPSKVVDSPPMDFGFHDLLQKLDDDYTASVVTCVKHHKESSPKLISGKCIEDACREYQAELNLIIRHDYPRTHVSKVETVKAVYAGLR